MNKLRNGISIIIPVYKQEEEIISRCVETIRSFQKKQDFKTELIIVCDNPERDIKFLKYLESDILIINEKNINKPASLVKAAKQANLSHFTAVDPDDELLPKKIDMEFEDKVYFTNFINQKNGVNKEIKIKNYFHNAAYIGLTRAAREIEVKLNFVMSEDMYMSSQMVNIADYKYLDITFYLRIFNEKGITFGLTDHSNYIKDQEYVISEYLKLKPNKIIEKNMNMMPIPMYFFLCACNVYSFKEWNQKIKNLNKSKAGCKGIKPHVWIIRRLPFMRRLFYKIYSKK